MMLFMSSLNFRYFDLIYSRQRVFIYVYFSLHLLLFLLYKVGATLFGEYIFIIVTVSFWVVSFGVTRCPFSCYVYSLACIPPQWMVRSQPSFVFCSPCLVCLSLQFHSASWVTWTCVCLPWTGFQSAMSSPATTLLTTSCACCHQTRDVAFCFSSSDDPPLQGEKLFPGALWDLNS